MPFVGRVAELDVLRQWWLDSDAGARVAFVLGEAGIGKTRLVSMFAREVEAGGGRVFYGRAVYAGASWYEPVLGVLRQFVATAGDDMIDRLGETAAGSLARIVPEMAERRPHAAAVASAWGDVDRSWLLGSVADAFAGTDASSTLLVLDDLQWADRPAVLLLSRLLEPDRQVRVLGTYRQPGGPPTTDLVDLLAELRRHDRPVLRLALGGLSPQAVVEVITALAGADLPGAGLRFASDLHGRTGGHPLFVRETLRHLQHTGELSPAQDRWAIGRLDEIGTAEGVKDVVGQRLLELSAPTRAVLETAAVMGVDFDVDIVSAAIGGEVERVIAAVEEATAVGLVSEDARRVDRHSFVHALVHDVVLAELSRSRRARLEWRIGEALEAGAAGEVDERAGQLADHFSRGAAVGSADKAFEWARRAGERATELVAHEDAVRYYDMALEALELVGGPVDQQRADVLLALGRAANLAGNPDRWRSSALEAAEIARRTGDPERLARAAISLLGTLSAPGVDETVLDVLEAAADLIRAGDPLPERDALLAELLARLSAYLIRTESDRSIALADEALEVARRAGDRRVLAMALVYSTQTHLLQRNEHHTRLREAEHLVADEGDLELVLRAKSALINGALIWAERDQYDRGLADYARVAGRMRAATPLVLSIVDHAGAAGLEGRYDDAKALFVEALRRSRALGDPFMTGNILLGLYPVARERGRITATDVEAQRQVVGIVPGLPLEGACRVGMLCDVGARKEASEALHVLVAQPDVFGRGPLRLYLLATLAEAAAVLHERDDAAILYQWLQDEGRYGDCVVIGAHIYFGALRRYLGLLALTIDAVPDAVDHHEAALVVHERMRARGWAARSRHDLAQALLARGAKGDADRAARLTHEAVETARRLGMPKLLGEIEAG